MSWLKVATSRLTVLTVAASTIVGLPAFAQDKPGVTALEQFREGRKTPAAIENRFFLKEKRFEMNLRVGYVPNNSFAARYVGGLVLNYHLNERIAVGADITYSPDFKKGDLKPLVGLLVQRARATNPDFQQPLDKVTLAATFGVTWSPVYGKINLLGETVLNFDFYTFAGIGMVSKVRYFGRADLNVPPDFVGAPNDFVELVPNGNAVLPAPTIGIGQNYFLSQTVALKIDLKAAFYIDRKPTYSPEPSTERSLYNNIVAGVGIGAFFPKMKPRIYDF